MSVCGGPGFVRFDGIGEAVDPKMSLIARAIVVVFPLACKTKAAEPATNGADEGQKSAEGRRESGKRHSTGHTSPGFETELVAWECADDVPTWSRNRGDEVNLVGRSIT